MSETTQLSCEIWKTRINYDMLPTEVSEQRAPRCVVTEAGNNYVFTLDCFDLVHLFCDGAHKWEQNISYSASCKTMIL